MRWVFNKRLFSKCMSEIESLSLQKRVVTTAMGFFGVPFASLTLLLVMVVVVHVVAIIQE